MVYRAAYVLPMDDQVIENGEVLVRDGLIHAVGENLSELHPDEPVTDLGKCALLPGFVNVHSHIEYTMSRNKVDALNLWDWIDAVGFNRNRRPEPEICRLSALLGAAELAMSGVTCVGDSSFTGMAAEALDCVGLRGITYLELFGQSAGDEYASLFHRALDRAREVQAGRSPRIIVGISPHSVYTSNRGLLELCAQACAESGVPISIHLAETQAEVDYCLNGTGPVAEWRRKLGYEPMVTGMRPAEYLHEIGLFRSGVCVAHCVWLTSSEIELVAESGVGVAHCPRSNAYLGSGVAPVTELVDSGARIGIGTDSAGSSLRLDFFEEMRFALGLQRARAEDASVLTASDVLRMSTLGGARALGLDGQIGTIEPGKRADMIAVDVSDMLPVENIWLSILSRGPFNVRLVCVDGTEVVRDGLLTGLDVDELIVELKERLGV